MSIGNWPEVPEYVSSTAELASSMFQQSQHDKHLSDDEP